MRGYRVTVAFRDLDIDPIAAVEAATFARHRALEEAVAIQQRIRTPEGYAQTIAILTAVHVRYEPQLAAYAPLLNSFGFSLTGREKVRALLVDGRRIIDAFGIASPPVDLAAAMPIVSSNDAVAWLYVFESATLAGVAVAQDVRSALGIPAAYYGIYGPRTAAMWRAFGVFFRAYVAADAATLLPIIDSVQDAFALIEGLFVAAPRVAS